jgi:hypothetical protein
MACDQVEQRRFAGAIWLDDRSDLAFGQAGKIDGGNYMRIFRAAVS